MGDLKGLILDLRQNPGGLLSEGVGVADKFLRKGQVIVSHHGRASPEKRLSRQPRQRRQGISAGRAGEPRHGFGGGNRRRRHSGPRPRPDRGRNHLRQGPGADRLSAFGKHRTGADHRQVLHAQRPPDPARLLQRLALRLLLQREGRRRTPATAKSSSPTAAARSTAAAASRRTSSSPASRATSSRTRCCSTTRSSTSPSTTWSTTTSAEASRWTTR